MDILGFGQILYGDNPIIVVHGKGNQHVIFQHLNLCNQKKQCLKCRMNPSFSCRLDLIFGVSNDRSIIDRASRSAD